MNIKVIDKIELKKIYEEYIINDFHYDELKPYNSMVNLINEGIYKCYGYYEEDNIIAYALFIKPINFRYAILDYYAVIKSYRSKSYGGKFINELANHINNLSGIIVEVESIEFAKDSEDREIRKRRIDFYTRNGFVLNNIKCKLFSVDYSIMTLFNKNIENNEDIYNELEKIYKIIFPKKVYEKYVKLELK